MEGRGDLLDQHTGLLLHLLDGQGAAALDELQKLELPGVGRSQGLAVQGGVKGHVLWVDPAQISPNEAPLYQPALQLAGPVKGQVVKVRPKAQGGRLAEAVPVDVLPRLQVVVEAQVLLLARRVS